MSESPIRLPVSPFRRGSGVLKIKRGGTGKVSNSGGHGRRFHTPPRAMRDPASGKHIPWPETGAPIWDPNNSPVHIEARPQAEPKPRPPEPARRVRTWPDPIHTKRLALQQAGHSRSRIRRAIREGWAHVGP